MTINYKQLLSECFEESNGQKDGTLDDRVLIVDSTNYFIRAFTAIPMVNNKQEHIGGLRGFLHSVLYTISITSPTRVILIFDGSNGSKFRKNLYSDYKAGRTNKLKLNRHLDLHKKESDEDSFRNQLIKLQDFLGVLPFTTIAANDIEADDVVAYLLSGYYKHRKGSKITIASSDKDFVQLINEDVKIYQPVKKTFYTPEYIQKNWNILPENYIIAKSICGDTSDNIKGVRMAGLKTLVKRFPKLSEEVVTMDYIYQECSDKVNEKSKIKLYGDILNERELIELNERLMQLHDVEIYGSKKLDIQKFMSDPINRFNESEFRRLYYKHGLASMGSYFSPHYISILQDLAWYARTSG